MSENTQPQERDIVKQSQIKHMVDRFLGWKLPENFRPDAGISFKATFNEHTPWPMKHEPTGTNLFDSEQAEAMVRYMIEGMPEEQPSTREVALEKALRQARAACEAVLHMRIVCPEDAQSEVDGCREAAEEKLREHPIFAFLDGAAPYDGVWFSERHPTEKGAFWWRKHLRAALKTAGQPSADGGKEK